MTASSIPSWGKASPSFATTRWSLVFAAGQGETQGARAALSTLCETYWYPLYAFVRRRGHDAQEAQDLTQGFFTRLLDKGDLVAADPDRGRFRAFLSVAIKNYIQNEWRKETAQKRGGTEKPISLDMDRAEERYSLEAVDDRTPEKLLDRTWALVLLEQVMERLRESYASSGKGELFDALQCTLTGGGATEKYSLMGEKLGMKEGAVKVAIHRLRKRFRAELQREICETVSDPDDVQAELAELFDALAG